MKKIILLLMTFLVVIVSYAQNRGFNYKALISDNGNVLPEQAVVVQFTILTNDAAVYEEEHISVTDSNGILIVNIGEGTVLSGSFVNIDWSQEQFLKVEIDTGNGLTDFGTTVFKSVPYAKYAVKSDFNNLENIPENILDGDDDTQLTESEVDAFVSNNGYLLVEVDGSVTNELQNLTINGAQLSLTDGNTITLPTGTTGATYSAGTGISISNNIITNTGVLAEVDGSVTNELQNLSINGTQLSLTNGNTVTLPAGSNYNAGTGISISNNIITNTGDINPNDDIVLVGGVANVNGDLVVSGEVQNPTISGDADMKAYMYGWINPSGTIITTASSGGFTSAVNVAVGRYRINFDTSLGLYTSYIIQANLIEANGVPGFVTTYQFSTYCDIFTSDISGQPVAKSFSFIIYKK